MGGGISFKLPSNHPNHFEIHHVLGKGGFAIVYRGIHRLNPKQIVAIKETKFLKPQDNENEIDMTLNELDALKKCGYHPFIVKLYSAFREYKTCYLILDPLLGGDLRYHLRNFQLFPEQHIAYYIACIGSAIHHLHKNGIIHRDIKPENILLSEKGIPYLSDFGTSYIFKNKYIPICNYSSGTLPYLAPEILTNSKRHSYQCDFWSLGVMAYEILFNIRPFDQHCPKEFIYFVDNHYHLLWEYIMASTNHHSDLDFELIYDSIDSKIREEYLPYPDHYVKPKSDDSLSEDFEIPIPNRTYCGEPVTEECISMLKSLLDVRIIKRIGKVNKFHEFTSHEWFQLYGYHQFDKLPTIRAPFLPNSGEIQKILTGRYQQEFEELKANQQDQIRIYQNNINNNQHYVNNYNNNNNHNHNNNNHSNINHSINNYNNNNNNHNNHINNSNNRNNNSSINNYNNQTNTNLNVNSHLHTYHHSSISINYSQNYSNHNYSINQNYSHHNYNHSIYNSSINVVDGLGMERAVSEVEEREVGLRSSYDIPLHIEEKLQRYSHNPPQIPIQNSSSRNASRSHNSSSTPPPVISLLPIGEMKPSPSASPRQSGDMSVSIASTYRHSIGLTTKK